MKASTPIIIIAISLAILTGCSGTKTLIPADVDMPTSYMPDLETDSASISDLCWWEFYADSTLTRLMRLALDNNRDLLKAAARVEQTRQLYGIDKANIYPEIGAIAAVSNETSDYNGSEKSKSPQYELKLTANWEINLWGSVSKARQAGAARYAASLEDYRAMRMTLIADVATTYFRLIALDHELSIVRQTLETRQQSLEQARLRFEGGLTSETVYQQAKVEYSTAASLVPNLESQVNVTRNALTLLLGEYPREIIERRDLAVDVTLPEKLPAGVPSTLLRRRPDLRAAEQRLKAAMADVGVSYAERFPSLNISLTAGLENDGLSNFFKSPYTYPLASITAPILDFGRRKRRYQAAIAAYDQSRYDYEKAVIQAFTEVNTALNSYRNVQETRKLKIELRDAAVKYVQLAHLQYRGGTLSYIDVLDAQRRYFDAQIGVSNALRDEYLALINLYKVLGGGWRTEPRRR